MSKDAGGALVPSSSAVQALNEGEIHQQLVRASEHRRSIEHFKAQAFTLACSSPKSAELCSWDLAFGGNDTHGPSVRFAEILMAAYGNLRVQTRIIGETETQVLAQAVAHDLETNNALSTEVARSIVGSKGQRYRQDLILRQQMAAQSIAKRNAILAIIPRAIWDELYERVRATTLQSEKPLAERVDYALNWFDAHGVPVDSVLSALGRANPEDLTPEDLRRLNGVRAAIQDGVAIEDAFQRPEEGSEETDQPQQEGELFRAADA